MLLSACSHLPLFALHTCPCPTRLLAPPQEELARGQREVTEQVYAGTYTFHPYNPFTEVVPEEKVSLETFKYVASLVSGGAAVGETGGGNWAGGCACRAKYRLLLPPPPQLPLR